LLQTRLQRASSVIGIVNGLPIILPTKFLIREVINGFVQKPNVAIAKHELRAANMP